MPPSVQGVRVDGVRELKMGGAHPARVYQGLGSRITALAVAAQVALAAMRGFRLGGGSGPRGRLTFDYLASS